jgi:small GTP-binding protein
MLQKKICMLGAFAVGKTSLVRRFVESMFDEGYHTTIGVKIDKKIVFAGGKQVTLMVWDLAGEDEVEQVRLSHLRGAAGYVLVVDGCRKGTLETGVQLRKRVEAVAPGSPWVLALNKGDVRSEWEIDASSIDDLFGVAANVLITSAKTGERVDEMFETLAARIVSGE